MDGFPSGQCGIIGREEELGLLSQYLDRSLVCKGGTIIVSGEPGIGKTRLIDEFKSVSKNRGVEILAGGASADTGAPFLVFSKALAGVTKGPLFLEEEYQSFAKIFAVNRSGMLVAQAGPEGETGLDADIFAGMLSAVQDFVRDSFDQNGEKRGGLGRLEYGDMKIIIEHGRHLFLTVVFKGAEHPDMKNLVSRTLRDIEEGHSGTLEKWDGRMRGMLPVQKAVESLSAARFLVKQTLEGMRLEKERARIAGNIFEILMDKSRNSPLILVLEDLHWADESSLFVLNYLARNVLTERILILGTARPKENPAFEALFEKMVKGNLVSKVGLRSLDMQSVSSLVNSVYQPNAFPDSFVKRLATECGGNPFFVIELLKQMRDDGIIRKDNGDYALIGEDFTIPGSVEAIVRRRLESLEPEPMILAEFASCIGREFDTRIILASRSLRGARASLEKLLASGIVTRNNGRAEFSHALFQETIYKGITPRWKGLHHKELGEHYEQEYANRLDEVIYELARHFSRSKEFEKTFKYCVRAGEKAESAFAAELALELYDAALGALPRLKISETARHEEEIRLNTRKGVILQFTGNWPEAEELYRKSIEIAILIKNERKRAEAINNLGWLLQLKGDYDDAKNILEDALRTFNDLDDKDGQIRAYNNLANVYLRRGEYPKAKEYYEKQLEISEAAGHKEGIGMAQGNLAIVNFYMGDNIKAMERFEKKLQIAKELNNKLMICHTIGDMGVVYQATGELDKAIECYERDLNLVTELGDKHGMNIALGNLGQIWLTKGDFKKANDLFEKKLKLVNELGSKPGLKSALRNMSDIAYEQGDNEKALGLALKHLALSEEMDDKQAIGEALTGLAKIHHARRELGKALEYAERGVELHRRHDMKQYQCENLTQKAWLLFDSGRKDEAKASIDEALRLAEEIKRPEHSFFAGIVNAKIVGQTDQKTALNLLEDLQAKKPGEAELAWVHYERFKLTGSGQEKEKALAIYSQLYEKSPRSLYKTRIDELTG